MTISTTHHDYVVMFVIFPPLIYTRYMLLLGLHAYSPLLAFCLCMVTNFFAELALGLVVRRLGDRFWLKRGFPVVRWYLDQLYFCGVHTQILLCCNITVIYTVDGVYRSYISKRSHGEPAPMRDAVSQ